MHHYIFPVLCLLSSFVSCTRMNEACEALCVADSLRAEGAAYPDSARIAGAVRTLSFCRYVYPDDYTKACYHYGRVLRERGDYVGAMQTFIDGAHTQYLFRPVVNPLFSDHSTLARIYSNMGSMCHLVDSFQLAHDMYELSAMHFYKACDSIK